MVLLDTHTLLWMFDDVEQLSEQAVKVLKKEKLCVSIASFWEMAIKASLPLEKRRLNLKVSLVSLADLCGKNQIEILSLTPNDCERLMSLPHIHDDPFDRIIIAQAMERGLPLVTRDQKIWQYADVEKVW